MAPAELLVRRITAAQDHVVAAVEGLRADDLHRRAAPSGWRIASLLTHLTYDVEVFWVHAVLDGRPEAIASLRDGWGVVSDDPVGRYARAVETSRAILAGRDLDAPPAWWPTVDVFSGRPYATGWDVALHVLTELATHAGHLDLAREAIDGHQHLVL